MIENPAQSGVFYGHLAYRLLGNQMCDPKEYEIKKLNKWILAWEDINFSIHAVEDFLAAPNQPHLEENCHDIKYHLFCSALVSYAKMFVGGRRNKLGPIKTKEFQVLTIPEYRSIHNDLLNMRNIYIAHNDGLAKSTFIGWSEKYKMHFPQRLKRSYWSVKEARLILKLMKAIEQELLILIMSYIKSLNLIPGEKYKLNSCVEKI